MIVTCQLKISTPAINIDTSVNAAFTADRLNTAKSNDAITDCWHVHYKHTKIFQSSLSHYDEVDKENYYVVIALHKCGTERVRIFELLNPLNIMRVFVYHTF